MVVKCRDLCTVYYFNLSAITLGIFLTVDGDFSAIDGHSPPFTLTFTSTNLPSTIVNWYLDGQRLNNITTTTVLSDPLTSKYIHTATLTERKGGIYKCSVTAISDQSTRAQSFDNVYFTVHGKRESYSLCIVTFISAHNLQIVMR